MNIDQTRRTLNMVTSILEQTQDVTRCSKAIWFLSFGSLLSFVRERGELGDDLDVSMMYGSVEPKQILSMWRQFGYEPFEMILDENGKLLKITFKATDEKMFGSIHIDIFFWIERGGYYFHTYNYYNELQPDNRLPRYRFKGIPKAKFEAGLFRVPWYELGYEINIPENTGEVLDYWYPAFMIKQDPCGNDNTSFSEAIVEVKKLENLVPGDEFNRQIEKSKIEYHELVNKIPGVTCLF